MRELKIGERIPVEAGGEAVVSRELGRGGQGIVYLVRYNGREYALKWYFISRIKNPEAFRNNLRRNIEDGAGGGGKARFLFSAAAARDFHSVVAISHSVL